MRKKLVSFDIVHPNFALKWALFFFDKLTLTNYKIHFQKSLESLYEAIDIEQKTFILGCLPEEIGFFDVDKPKPKTSIVGAKKMFTKDVISTSNAKYKNFDVDSAVPTYEIFGKHIAEFPREKGEFVPEVFTLIFEYFYQNPKYIKKEGVFRLSGNAQLMKEIEDNITKGNYEYLAEVDDPFTVGVFLKKILRELGEPLWTFELYTQFKDINDEKWGTPEEKIDQAFELIEKLPDLNRETFKALLKFLRKIADNKEDNKMRENNLAIVFAPNIFRAYEVTQNDMIYAQVLVKTLTLMIVNYED